MKTISPSTHPPKVHPCLIVDERDFKSIAAILHWWHQRGGEAHCLVRIYVYPALSKALAIISELRSNPYGRGITSDFNGIANALIQLLGLEREVSPENIIWIEHYGKFSYSDALDEEAFSQVDLKWNGQSFKSQASDWHLLNPSEVTTILGDLELEPVPQVLEKLGWKQKSHK